MRLLSMTFSQVFLGIGRVCQRVAKLDAPQPMPMMVLVHRGPRRRRRRWPSAPRSRWPLVVYWHASEPARCRGRDGRRLMRDYIELTKPRITWLILMSTGIGYFFGLRGAAHWWNFSAISRCCPCSTPSSAPA